MKSKAFTLIELLIVVAIIAILAAIAVPNFLEAQTRSKVARTKADMRTISIAIESYTVDNNKTIPIESWYGSAPWWENTTDHTTNYNVGYVWWLSVEWDKIPTGMSPPPPSSHIGTGRRLTSPIAYLATIPGDVFMTAMDRVNSEQWWGAAVNTSSCWYRTGKPINFQWNGWGYTDIGYRLESCGPDLRMTQATGGMATPTQDHWVYDPTNGTVSNGDIIYLGKGAAFPN